MTLQVRGCDNAPQLSCIVLALPCSWRRNARCPSVDGMQTPALASQAEMCLWQKHD